MREIDVHFYFENFIDPESSFVIEQQLPFDEQLLLLLQLLQPPLADFLKLL